MNSNRKNTFQYFEHQVHSKLTLGLGTPFGGWHRNSIWFPSSTG